ncbi:MAG: radical SAM family heme chaperone HemW [Pirellulales bacterium]|nr:radical SAM family heme chaperone HemW [Pirellulales bacterium]
MRQAAGDRQAKVSSRSAYIHVPFCQHRCGYCNFTLVAGRDDLIEPFLSSLERELGFLGQPCEVDTLFLGGGTPTHLRGDQLRRLLEIVLRWHPLSKVAEFSVEANPSDIDAETVDILANSGTTRLSLGAQSLHAEKLRLLERDHTAEQIATAIDIAGSRRLDVSLDLIFSAPGETLAQWRGDLQAAIGLCPDHISTYGLTLERGTTFWNRLRAGHLQPLGEEEERQMYATAIDDLTAAGFEHYEVSNFARPGKRCHHNEVYWTGGEYFAAGPSAARHIDGVRETNVRSVTAWLQKLSAGQRPIAEQERLSPEDRARELLVFGLRRLQGVRRGWFADRTGYEIDKLFAVPLRRFVVAGLLADDGDTVRLTREGLFVSDALWPHFLGK